MPLTSKDFQQGPETPAKATVKAKAPAKAKTPAATPDPDKQQAKASATKHVVAAARALERGWEASGFYDRQDAALALALREALNEL